jgi:hypothetical protein
MAFGGVPDTTLGRECTALWKIITIVLMLMLMLTLRASIRRV